MKNFSSKLFGGLTAIAFVVGTFSMTSIEAAPVSLNDVQIEETCEMNSAEFADVWIICDNFVFKCTTPADQY